MNHGWQSEATDGPRAAKRKESAKRKKSADRSGKYFSTPETWTVECNCRRIFANIWFSQVWKHSSYTYAIPWCFKIWAWLRHEFLETAIPWWFTSKFWPRHELGMSLSFDCMSCDLDVSRKTWGMGIIPPSDECVKFAECGNLSPVVAKSKKHVKIDAQSDRFVWLCTWGQVHWC